MEQRLQTEFNADQYQDIRDIVLFEYQNPYQNFNRSQVLGKLSTLFKVTEPDKYSLALQTAAGIPRLKSVVVSQQNAAKDLINGRVLNVRVTFMPLNQIRYQKVDRAKVQKI